MAIYWLEGHSVSEKNGGYKKCISNYLNLRAKNRYLLHY